MDTLQAEGQRLHAEILSAYACEFLEQMEWPDVEKRICDGEDWWEGRFYIPHSGSKIRVRP